mgnify:CR=1 FL=1
MNETIKSTLPVETHPFAPFLPEKAKILILGSFPPKKERWSMDFFYPNFNNDMWRIFGLVFFLTSSMRTPKFISKQWSDTLMPFHKHSPIDSLLALRQCHLYCHDCPGKSEHLVHTHIYVG